MPNDKREQLPFDDTLAITYVGKYVLVGITYVDSNGKLLRQQELHGRIQSASLSGILIALEGIYKGETWNMPPLLEVIRPAKPGIYQLETTKEVIENPDLLATWRVTNPAPPN